VSGSVTGLNKQHIDFLTRKPTRCTNISNLFWNETLHGSDSSSVHHQEFFTVHTAVVYVIQVCGQLSVKLHNIYRRCVYGEKLLMTDRGTVRNTQSFIPKWIWEISAFSWFII